MLDSTRRDAGISLVDLPHLVAGGRWHTAAMRSYAQPVLYWFAKGRGRMTIRGVTRSFGPQDVIVIPDGVMHGFDATREIDGVLLFLGDELAASLPEEPRHLTLHDTTAQSELAGQIDNIRTELSCETDLSARALGFHTGLLAVWLERQENKGDAPDATARPRACETLAEAYTALLERYFRDGHTVADFARALGVTPAHLSRACRLASGRPASAFLQDRIHFEARRLLQDTTMPIRDVAQTLGFTSHAYFTRAFQARNGMTPSAFRRSETTDTAH